jgi:hypothetical protein
MVGIPLVLRVVLPDGWKDQTNRSTASSPVEE